MKITKELLDELERKHAATSEGTWVKRSDPRFHLPEAEVLATRGNVEVDWDFVCDAHNVWPALLREIRELHELRDRMRWKPIGDIREEDCPVILIDINDPGSQVIADVRDHYWDDASEGMTHFVPIPYLSTAEAITLKAQQKEIEAARAAAESEDTL